MRSDDPTKALADQKFARRRTGFTRIVLEFSGRERRGVAYGVDGRGRRAGPVPPHPGRWRGGPGPRHERTPMTATENPYPGGARAGDLDIRLGRHPAKTTRVVIGAPATRNSDRISCQPGAHGRRYPRLARFLRVFFASLAFFASSSSREGRPAWRGPIPARGRKSRSTTATRTARRADAFGRLVNGLVILRASGAHEGSTGSTRVVGDASAQAHVDALALGAMMSCSPHCRRQE